MRKTNYLVLGFMTLITFFALNLSSPAKTEAADVDFYLGIGINTPPVRVVGLPPLFLISEAPVYYTPYFDVPIFFYAGYWYRLFDGGWYRAVSHAGPWHYIRYERVPSVIVKLPRYYYQTHNHYKHKFHERKGFQKKHKDRWERTNYRKYY